MTLSKKRIIILWVTVLLVVVFLGLDIKDRYYMQAGDYGTPIESLAEVPPNYPSQYIKTYKVLTFCGEEIFPYGLSLPPNPLSYFYYGLLFVPCHILKVVATFKPVSIVATLLIGLALFMTMRKK